MRILLDCNSDRIILNPDENDYFGDVVYEKSDMRNQMIFIGRLLEEIFNRSIDTDGEIEVIKIEMINEDVKSVIGEW